MASAERAFVRVDDHFSKRLFSTVVDRHRAHEFGKHESRPADSLGDLPERGVRNILHGRDDQRWIDAHLADDEPARWRWALGCGLRFCGA